MSQCQCRRLNSVVHTRIKILTKLILDGSVPCSADVAYRVCWRNPKCLSSNFSFGQNVLQQKYYWIRHGPFSIPHPFRIFYAKFYKLVSVDNSSNRRNEIYIFLGGGALQVSNTILILSEYISACIKSVHSNEM